MARFYGTVQGGRGEATRLGHATGGLRVTAQSYSGDVVINVFDQDGEDSVHIRVRKHGDCGYGSQTIYCGPIAKLLDANARGVLMRALIDEELTS